RNKNGNKTENQTGGNDATARAYAIGGGGENPDSNVITGTFLLNSCYASMLTCIYTACKAEELGTGIEQDHHVILNNEMVEDYLKTKEEDVTDKLPEAIENLANTHKRGCCKGTGVDKSRIASTLSLKKKFKYKMTEVEVMQMHFPSYYSVSTILITSPKSNITTTITTLTRSKSYKSSTPKSNITTAITTLTRSKSYKLLPHQTGHVPPRVSLFPATVVGYFTFSDEKRRFGSPPPASGDSPLFSESDPGTLAASAAAATRNHRRCRQGPPPLTGKFISLWVACLLPALCVVYVLLAPPLLPLSACGIRVGSWNVGSLTSKLFELSDALGRHKVDIACFQETRWKGSRVREGNDYKLWYSGSSSMRNGIGVVVAGRLMDDVVRVTRRSYMIMGISMVIDGEAVNVISAYAP
ncbi:retrovirus-related pol polyprotein LINE-1, partial [Tanacetum coccineum]